MTGNEQNLDALLSSDIDPLPPPPGAWDLVRRRARRRRWAKAGLAVASVAVVAAGAVPAALTLHGHQDNQQVRIGGTPTPPPPNPSSRAIASPLAGFAPTSASFVSQTQGFLFGTTDGAAAQLAVTTNGGYTWSPVPAPPVDADEAGMRFADSNVGFVFGKRYYVTFDAGRTWTREPSPGRIVDLETMNGKVWALVRRHSSDNTVELFGATLTDPTLRRVKSVPALPDLTAAGAGDSIAVLHSSVDVIAGAQQFWSTPDGTHWQQGSSPCAADADSARVAAWSETGVVVACGDHATADSETKRVFDSSDAGTTWTPARSQPATAGRLSTLGAGTAANVIVGTTGGGGQLTPDGGASWQTPSTYGIPLGFVGFIDTQHIVALPDQAASDVSAFLFSTDAGQSWAVTRFPN